MLFKIIPLTSCEFFQRQPVCRVVETGVSPSASAARLFFKIITNPALNLELLALPDPRCCRYKWVCNSLISNPPRIPLPQNTSSPTPQSDLSTSPDCSSGPPFSGISCKNHPNPARFSGKRPIKRIQGKRGIFHATVKRFCTLSRGKIQGQLDYSRPDRKEGLFSGIPPASITLANSILQQGHTSSHGSFLRRRTRAALCLTRTVSKSLRREKCAKEYDPAPSATSCRSFNQCPPYQKANTDVFSQGYFCRNQALRGLPGSGRDRPSRCC